MPPTLPEPIAAFFDADRLNPDAVARCFTPRATVIDEGQVHRGVEAIRAWKKDASTKYVYTSEPFALESSDGVQVVTSRVTGNFPGSPVDLRYRFRLERGLISSLDIAP